MKGLVISGGSSKGAWVGGALEYLIKEQKQDWDVYCGTSVGSIVSTFVSFNKIDKLKELFFNFTYKTMFNDIPFRKNGKLKYLKVVWKIIRHKLGLSQSLNIKSHLFNTISEEEYKDTHKIISSTSTNYNSGETEYVQSNLNNYNDFITGVWSSSLIPILIEPYIKNNKYYFDGGISTSVPIQKCIYLGCDEIDVFILKSKTIEDKNWKPNNIFDIFSRTLNIMLFDISQHDIEHIQFLNHDKPIKINIYNLPEELTNNIFKFDKEQMIRWWKEGYEYMKTYFYHKTSKHIINLK
jgi:predicted patatin/cPLA2 family phospholipase